jgi:amino acid permease
MASPDKEIFESKAYDGELPVRSNTDIERGEVGIKVQANPLARKLQSRHMQMIAIGTEDSLHDNVPFTHHINV